MTQILSNGAASRDTALGALGTTIGGRWTLLGVIGVGGTATVYEAVHRNGNRVALKVLHTELASHDTARRRFLAEGRAANLVQHDGVVTVLDEGETADGGAFLVMQLLQGESLAARLRRDGPLPWREVLEFGFAISGVLAAAHAHKVVHRDVKPSNIFVTNRAQVKLLDFGMARIMNGESLTNYGSPVGTPAFMAPEQAAGATNEIGPATDIWGLGATLFHLLTGRPVHDVVTEDARVASAASMAAPPITAFAPDLPAPLAKVIDRALSFQASDRWPSALSMQRALALAREHCASLPPQVGLDTRSEVGNVRARRSRVSTWRLAPAAVLMLGGCVAYWTAKTRLASDTVAQPSGADSAHLPQVAAPLSTPASEPSPVNTRRNGTASGAPEPEHNVAVSPSPTTLNAAAFARLGVPSRRLARSEPANSDTDLDRRK